MRLGRHARIQCQLHSPDDGLVVVMKNDIGHFTITAAAAKHLTSQYSASTLGVGEAPAELRTLLSFLALK